MRDVTMATVHRNTPWLLSELLYSWDKFYPNVGVVVLDSSTGPELDDVRSIIRKYGAGFVRNYGASHGAGLARGMNTVGTDLVLFLDTDVRIKKAGYVENLVTCLSKMHYGAGMVTYVDSTGLSIPKHKQRAIPYLHPHFMLVNLDKAMMWPMPSDHGAPMLSTMKAIHRKKKSHILVNLRGKMYYEHLWSGTVKKLRWPVPEAPLH
jgi:hypothetical protein